MHHHHHRGSSGGGIPAVPPPPPVLTGRSSRGSGSRPSGRSRSRSRSPPGGSRGSSRYHGRSSDQSRDRDLRERERLGGEREQRDRDRDRERRRSPSPYRGSSRDRERDRKHPATASSSVSKGSLQSVSTNVGLEALQSISLITADAAPTIIRRILNPEDVKIPRRVGEGSRPIFDRDELREAMRRRMRANDNEENPPQPNTYITEPTVTQQRVVAIIREPVGGPPDMYLASKDPAFQHAIAATKLSSGSVGASHLQTIPPDAGRSTASYHRRSPSPPSSSRSAAARQSRFSSPPPLPSQLASSSRQRSVERERERERERILMEREREQIQIHRAIEREREQQGGRGGGGPSSRDRERERERIPERERDRPDQHRIEHERPKPRYTGPGVDSRRSRSPICRVPREDMRIRRRSRSHSVTPPPMPEELRRQLIDRQRSMDLRNSLSRKPGQYLPPHDDRVPKGRGGGGPRGGIRGRGGFSTRLGRARDDDGRVWVHDMYDGDEEPKKGN
ncbi:hypothetical protein Ocin01_14461 [Orchesella cincta]|uniref:Uncharacterized protein n=1 Tax=Orchesella cincta TaxID=48709 RepID=A0A1D2MH16_ORCCI|nr:hypothetical protein Ocin01_14461 [Orchesella cincta]